ncbi:MAG: DUF3460 family protein [Burkholderiaceae bacterium]
MYESDVTRFLRELKTARPELDQKQREARAIWWDHPQDPEVLKSNAESRVSQKPYVYQTKD